MTDTIRRLYYSDWAIIEPVIDSRRKFQGTPLLDSAHVNFKENYVRQRLMQYTIFWFGYFVDDQLLAVQSFSRRGNWEFLVTAGWTMAGASIPRSPGSLVWNAYTIELLNHGLNFFREQEHNLAVWVIGPYDSAWVPQTTAPACLLADPTKYAKEVMEILSVGAISKFPFVHHPALAYVKPQIISRFVDLNPAPWPDNWPEPRFPRVLT